MNKMCLEVLIQVDPSAQGPISPPTLKAVSNLAVREVNVEGHTAFHISTDGTCSCGLLAAGCDPESERWTFADESLDPLARLVEALAAKGRTFRFLARWPGAERLRLTEQSSAARFASLVRTNTVRNNVLYEVRT